MASTGRSPPPIRVAGRGSLVTWRQLAPASSDRYIPTSPLGAPGPLDTDAYRTFGSLGAIRNNACWTGGNPWVSFFQVLPPSVDLKMPPSVPPKCPFSHGACCCCQRVAYRTSELLGSISMSSPLVYSLT